MKYLYTIIICFLITCSSVLSQLKLDITEYPPISKTIDFPEYNWKEINTLKENGLPRKAIDKIKELQEKAIAEKNISEFWKSCEELDKLFNRAHYESDENQLFVWEFAQKAEKIPFPMNNLLHYQVSKWINSLYWRGDLTFDDESLLWNIYGKQTKLLNQSLDTLFDFHQKSSLFEPMELMKISAKIFTNSENSDQLKKYTSTLFEFIANKVIHSPNNFRSDYGSKNRMISDSTFYGLTNNLVKGKDFFESDYFNFQLYYHIEQLCLKNKRFDAYAFWVDKRLKSVKENSTYENINDFDKEKLMFTAYYRFEAFLKESPASARFSYHIANELNEKSRNYNWKTNQEPKNNCVLALKTIEKPILKFPNSEFIDELIALKKYILSDDLNFSIKGDFIKGNESLLNVEYRNVYHAALKIYKIEKETKNIHASNLLKNYVLTSVYSQDLNFEKDSLYLKHDKDFIIPKLSENGSYLFIVARSSDEIEALLKVDTLLNRKNFSYKVFQLSTLQVLTNNKNGKIEFLVSNSISGKPIEKAEIQLKRRYYRNEPGHKIKDTTIYSNANGLAYFQANDMYEYSVKLENDSLNGSIYSYLYSGPNEQNKYKIYTDRSIYRPSQEVFIKIIGYQGKNNDLKLIDDKKVNVKVKDQNSKTIWETTIQLNEFGSSSCSFTLPKDGFLLGYLTIYVNENTSHSIQVEEYKRPTFEVTFDEIKGKIKLGDSLAISGTVKAFAGYPISNALVKISISQHNYCPRWCDVHSNERMVSKVIEVMTDANGNFKFVFLPTRVKYMYGSNFTFNAIVTDISGEVQEAQKSLYVGNESYSISMFVPENIIGHQENKVKVVVQNSQSIEQKEASIEYSIVKITNKKWFISSLDEAEFKVFSTKEFEKKFPQIRYFQNQYNDQTDTLVKGKIKSGDELDLNKLVQNNPGHYSIITSTIDETGEKIVNKSEFNFIKPLIKKDQHQSEFWIVSPSKNYKIGDEVEIILGSSYKKLSVYIEHQNSLGETTGKWINLKQRTTLKYKITEKEKDGFLVSCISSKNGKLLKKSIKINVINNEKKLDIQLQTIRDYLKPGSLEKWSVSISDLNGKNSNSELLAGMYDASLNQFRHHYWDNNFYRTPSFTSNWNLQNNRTLLMDVSRWNSYNNLYRFEDEEMNFRGGRRESYSPLANMYGEDSTVSFADGSTVVYSEDSGSGSGNGTLLNKSLKLPSEIEIEDSKPVILRTNFNETAFFYPNIYADTSGNYRFEYTLPDAITRWQFMAFAHTKDLKTGYFKKSFEAKKEVMVEPNEPRFFREGDAFVFSSKVVNTTDKNQDIVVRLKLIDPITEKAVTSLFGQISEQKITVPASSSQEVSWNLNVPTGKLSMVAYLIEAQGNSFLDAEKKALPILSNRMLVSESKPFVKTSAGDKTFTLDKINQLSPTAEKISLTLEMQTQPLWTTLMSLPYLMEFPHECTEQIFSRYFGNVLAQKIINDNPEFKHVIETWKQNDPKAFLSELEKNAELKSIILNETPWLSDAQNETEQRQHLALLFDGNNLNSNIASSLNKLKELKASDGGWSWFGGEKSNYYITQHIVSGFGQLKQLGVQIDEAIVQDALHFLDAYYLDEFKKLKKENKEKLLGLSEIHVHWLVARSYFKTESSEAVKYYSNCLTKDWKNFNLHTQALAGMSAVRSGDKAFAEKIKNSILDRATKRPEMGMYWNENKTGYYWNQSQVETQSAVIEFFSAIGNLDKEIQLMQLWLVQQKRSAAWETTKATTKACHALLVNKASIQNQLAQVVKVRLGDGTDLGTLNTNSGSTFHWTGTDINAGKASVTVNTANDQAVFGAIHLQYLEDMDKITKSAGDIRLERHYYWTNNGKEEEIFNSTILPIGTKVKVKMTVVANRMMEFVHLKDSKAAGFEARETLSGYHYSTVSYYQISKDASTEIFIESLPKGTHIFEYEIFVSGKGELSVGAAIVECMYAPSFRANSSGGKFIVK